MKEFFDVLNTRRSIRKFTDEPVSEKDICEMVSAAAMAPSACNCQSYTFIAVRDKEKITRFAQLVCEYVDDFYASADEAFLLSRKKQMTFFAKAPVVFFVTSAPFTYHDSRVTQWYHDKGYSDEDMSEDMGFPMMMSVGAAIENLLLAAHAKGLGACWMLDPIPAREKLEQELNCKGRLMAVIPVGYPAYEPREKTLKPMEQILTII